MATRNALSPDLNVIKGCISGASGFTGAPGAPLTDGDILNVPAGSANWDDELVIDIGIELIGKTKIDSTVGNLPDNLPYPTTGGYSAATDLTFITRSSINGGHTFIINASNGKKIRLSGFTLTTGTSTTGQGAIHVTGTCTTNPALGTTGVRIDNMHFANVAAANPIHTFGCVFGVMDHCLVEMSAGQLCLLWHGSYVEPSGGTRINGEGSWADHANWGSYKFWFFEDCIFRGINLSTGVSPATIGNFDGKQGGRGVMRHCRQFDHNGPYFHGTESSLGGNTEAERGGRCWESYSNVSYRGHASSFAQLRSGNILLHDNDIYGSLPSGALGLTHYRQDEAWAGFGGVCGNNPWDDNDPTLYASGTALISTGDGLSGDITLIASGTPNWQTNQWVGYFLTNIDQGTNTSSANAKLITKGLSYNSARIMSNTDHTMTCNGVGTPEFRPALIWVAGNHFQVRKCLHALDQAGRGKGDYVTYGAHQSAGNTLGGTSCWPNQVSEPSYAWNNRFSATTPANLAPNAFVNLQSAYPTILSGGTSAYNAGFSFYNRAPGTAQGDTSAPFVGTLLSTGYTTYTYPHPLVAPLTSGGGTISVTGPSSVAGGTTAKYTISDSALVASGPVVINYNYGQQTGDTAVAATDYTAPTGSTSITTGNSSVDVNIAILSNPGRTDKQSTFYITSISGDSSTLDTSSRSIATTITNMVTATVSVTSPASGSVTEGSTATFTITTSGNVASDTTVNYTMSGSAVAGINYTITGLNNTTLLGTAVITAGTKTKAVTVNTTLVAGVQSNLTATMALNSGTGYTLATISTDTLVIVDSGVVSTAPPPPTIVVTT